MLASSSTTRTRRSRERRALAPSLSVRLRRRAGRAATGAAAAGRRRRQDDAERRALALARSRPDAAAVGAHDVLDDGEAEAAALPLAREPVVDAVELVEDAPVLAARDAVAVVGHLERHALGRERGRAAARRGGVPPYLSAFCSRLPSASAIAARPTLTCGRSGVDLDGEVELRVPVAQGRERLDRVRRRRPTTVLGAQLEELAPGLHAPPVEQALDELREPLGLALERARGTCPRVAWSPRARSRVSAKRRMLVSGVRSSWLTFETKSAWSSLRLASRRRKTRTRTMPVTATSTKLTVRTPKRRLNDARR